VAILKTSTLLGGTESDCSAFTRLGPGCRCGVGLVHFAVRFRGNLRGEGNDVADITKRTGKSTVGGKGETRRGRIYIILCSMSAL